MSDIQLRCISSGSKGNAWLLRIFDTRILLDAGVSAARLKKAIGDFGGIDAILLTHAHHDHCHGLELLRKTLDAPVLATSRTLKTLALEGNPLKIDKTRVFQDVDILPIRVSHDSNDTVGFRISSTHFTFGFLTDLGVWNEPLAAKFEQLQMLVIEANHDPMLLQSGPYPLHLKRRISGPLGHLSNQQAAQFVRRVSHDGLKDVILAHLSETNNSPDHARKSLAEVDALVHVATPQGQIDLERQGSRVVGSERQLSFF